jgi:hypothetical protein
VLRGKRVRAPDGAEWVVRRRWMDRRVPKVAERVKEYAPDLAIEGGLDGLWIADSLTATILLGVAIVLTVFVLLPVLGFAIELILLILILSSGVFGRIVLGRPWIVEARNLTKPGRPLEFPVKGWRRSGELIRQLVSALQATGVPPAADSRESAKSPG